MRRSALIGAVAALAVATPVALAATGDEAARPASLADALAKTAQTRTQQVSAEVAIERGSGVLRLRIRSAALPGKLAAVVRAAEGTAEMDVGLLLDGPFLYERAPKGMTMGGLRWVRLRVADLGPGAPGLRLVRSVSPGGLLELLGKARTRTTASPGVFRGSLAYDDPAVRSTLGALTNDVEFRFLRVQAWTGTDGRVHRMQLTGRTADGSATLRLTARFHGFGRAVRADPPPQRAFLDSGREVLAS